MLFFLALCTNSSTSHSYPQLNEPPNNHPELPPVFTKNFGVKAVMKTSVLLTWEVPETYKSQVPLKVRRAHNSTKTAPTLTNNRLK